MYSGTTFRKNSGNFIGVHQKIDRVSRKNLTRLLTHAHNHSFPAIREILHFEGDNGPDGIKRKSPSVDEPWHYINPADPNDRELIDMVEAHVRNLSEALREGNRARAAFEAAWMGHAITDGLTPAHHFPLSDKIEELWGKPKEERLTVIDKNVIRGETHRDTIARNWEYWGAKGVFATHILFELGVAMSIKTTTFPKPLIDITWYHDHDTQTVGDVLLAAVTEVYELNMYEDFWRNGWSAKLARQTRNKLIPIIARTIAFAWYRASEDAGIVK